MLLTKALEEPASEERSLAVANLLGECRFGYRAALSAWPENEAARRGLDQALMLVVEHELSTGDVTAAATLLREVSAPPPEVVAKVEAATRARHEHDARLKQLEADYDPRVGSRTRTFIGGVFGALWTVSPLVGWGRSRPGDTAHVFATISGAAIVFLALGIIAFVWARETLSKTRLNRRLALSLGTYLVAQTCFGLGAELAGFTMQVAMLSLVSAWMVAYAMLAIWAERGFAFAAVACAFSFLAGAAFPRWLPPLLSLDNLVLTLVVVLVWFPKQDFERMQERRREIRRRARKWLSDAVTIGARADDE